ncbi:MAG TPA: hypothetical protein VKR31_06770 [Rhizomicrobium sp.]|nr:hypothetical protein [Rhizomicrobium sp.]
MAYQIPIDLVFERTSDGRYRVTSDDVPGFYIAGSDIDAIQGDLNEIVADLLRHNCGFIVSEIRWMPSLSDVKRHLQKPTPEGRVRYIASGMLAA